MAEENEDLLWDGIHLKPAAAGLYARLVSTAVRAKVAFPPPPRKKAVPPKRPVKPARKQPAAKLREPAT